MRRADLHVLDENLALHTLVNILDILDVLLMQIVRFYLQMHTCNVSLAEFFTMIFLQDVGYHLAAVLRKSNIQLLTQLFSILNIALFKDSQCWISAYQFTQFSLQVGPILFVICNALIFVV